ncbi:chromate transporter [Consotaella aegiceratis]|uniref:chromate transporter n=1 Tax=Consotaella aegiceratis TaxID=3097961 RepID=UPI002F41E9F4
MDKDAGDGTGSGGETRNPAGDAPSVLQLFLIFSRIGLTSFGGGISAWLLREFVQDRHWLTEEEFFNGLAVSQALPGVNVKNMAIWIGYRLRGRSGAIAGFFGIIVPPAFVLIAIGIGFASISQYEATHWALMGAATAAVGFSLSVALTAARNVPKKLFPLALMAATFVAVGVLRWSLVSTVLIAGTVGVAMAYRELGRRERP